MTLLSVCEILYAYIHRNFYLKDRVQFYFYYVCRIFFIFIVKISNIKAELHEI